MARGMPWPPLRQLLHTHTLPIHTRTTEKIRLIIKNHSLWFFKNNNALSAFSFLFFLFLLRTRYDAFDLTRARAKQRLSVVFAVHQRGSDVRGSAHRTAHAAGRVTQHLGQRKFPPDRIGKVRVKFRSDGNIYIRE